MLFFTDSKLLLFHNNIMKISEILNVAGTCWKLASKLPTLWILHNLQQCLLCKMELFDFLFKPLNRIKLFVHDFALNPDKTLQIYFFWVKRRAQIRLSERCWKQRPAFHLILLQPHNKIPQTFIIEWSLGWTGWSQSSLFAYPRGQVCSYETFYGTCSTQLSMNFILISIKMQTNANIYTPSRKHTYIIWPLKPHFYKVKLGFTGVYIIFLISAQNHRLWVLVRTASSTSTHNLCFKQKFEKYQNFYLKTFSIWWWNFQYILNRPVFVMPNILSLGKQCRLI